MRDDRINLCDEFSLENYPFKYPHYTTISAKNLKNAIRWNTKKYKSECEDVWITDVRKTHVRNRRLLDSPFTRASCCSKIYNKVVDQMKLKKLRRYNLSRPVRTIESDLEPEVIEKCVSQDFSNEEEPPEHIVDEFFQSPDSDSDEEDHYLLLQGCESGSLSECSGCSTIGPLQRQKVHAVRKKRWQDLLHGSQVEYCKNVVVKMMTKYKGRPDELLKLEKYYLR